MSKRTEGTLSPEITEGTAHQFLTSSGAVLIILIIGYALTYLILRLEQGNRFVSALSWGVLCVVYYQIRLLESVLTLHRIKEWALALASGGEPAKLVRLVTDLAVLICLVLIGWFLRKLSFAETDIWFSCGYRYISYALFIYGTDVIGHLTSFSKRRQKVIINTINPDCQPQIESLHRLKIAHWTDLHLTDSESDVRSETGTPGGNLAFKLLVEKYHERLLREIDVILVTGDITDSGTEGQWMAFMDTVPNDIQDKLVLVPGNHELNISRNHPEDMAFALPWGGRPIFESISGTNANRMSRWLRFLVTIERIQGTRSRLFRPKTRSPVDALRAGASAPSDWKEMQSNLNLLRSQAKKYGNVIPPKSMKETVSLQDAINEIKPLLEHQIRAYKGLTGVRFDKSFKNAGALSMAERGVFPMVISVNNSDLSIIILNSNEDSSNLITNAFGRVDPLQIALLEVIIHDLSSAKKPYIIAMHHHIGIPLQAEGFFEKLKERGMAIVNPNDLLHAIFSGQSTVLFNGHRHLQYSGVIDDRLQIIAGASTTLGDERHPESTRRAGFNVIEVGWNSPGSGVRVVKAPDWWGIEAPLATFDSPKND